MGLKDFFINFFEETFEEIQEDLKETNELIKELTAKLKKRPKKKSVSRKIVGIFDESREELKEELKEAEQAKKDLELRLKKAKTRKKTKKNVNYAPLLIVLGIIVLIALLIYLYIWYTGTHCMELRNSIGDVSIGCLELNEPGKTNIHEVSFYFKNNQPYKASCFVSTTIKLNGIKISEKTNDLGVYGPNEIRQETIKVNIPEGRTEFEVAGACVE